MKRSLILILSALPFGVPLSGAEPIFPDVKKHHSATGHRAELVPSSRASQKFQIGVLLLQGADIQVKGTVKGSAASEAGIREGDRILAVNGIKVSKVEALQAIISAAGSQELKLSIQRDEKDLRVKVTPKPELKVYQDVELDLELLPREANEAARVQLKPLSADDVEIEVRPIRPAAPPHHPAGGKVEQLLGEILGELKKMNHREAQVLKRPPLSSRSTSNPRVLVPQTSMRSDAPSVQKSSKSPRVRRVPLPLLKGQEKANGERSTPGDKAISPKSAPQDDAAKAALLKHLEKVAQEQANNEKEPKENASDQPAVKDPAEKP